MNKRSWLKWLLIVAGIVLLFTVGVIWYIFTATFPDTVELKEDYSLNASDLIRKFRQDDRLANRIYAEKIILVKGVVSNVDAADTSINIKMADTASGDYIIFAFQAQHLSAAKKIKEGDSIAIKGSCSGGAYSQILETEYITFKRSAIILNL